MLSRRPRIPPFAPIAPVAQHRGGDAQLADDLQQRPTTARQQRNGFSLELIGELTPSLTHSTPFRSRRSLAKVSINSGRSDYMRRHSIGESREGCAAAPPGAAWHQVIRRHNRERKYILF